MYGLAHVLLVLYLGTFCRLDHVFRIVIY